MANLGQLAMIRGAVRGYDAGEMNEQQLQQWLIDFKEKQRQFNVQSGQQQGYLDIAKEDVQMRKQRRVEEKATFDWEQKGKDALEAKGYHPLEADKIIGGIRGQIEQGDIERTLRSYRREAITDPRFKEESIAGEIERARMTGLGVRGLEAEVEEKEAVADITGAEASVADQIANLKVKATVLGIQTAEARLQQLQQEIEAFPIDKAQRRQYMDTLIKQLEVATTGAEFENMLDSILQDVTVEGKRLANEALQEDIASSKAQTGIRQFEATTRRMSVNLAKEAREKLDAAGERGYSDSTVNVLFKDMLDSRTELEDQIFAALESPLTKEQIGMMDNRIKAYKQTYNNTAAMLSGGGLGLVIDWTEQPLNVRQYGGARRLWMDKDVPQTLPYPRSTRVMTPEEQAAYAEKGIIPNFGVKEQPSAENLRKPQTTTGLTLEVRQQYVDRVKQAPDAEIQAIQNEFLGKYSNAEWNKIIREAMK